MLLLVAAFQLLTAPVSAHMISRVAYRRRHVRRDLLLVDELRTGESQDTGVPRATSRPTRPPEQRNGPSAQLTQLERQALVVAAQRGQAVGLPLDVARHPARRADGRDGHLDVVDGVHRHVPRPRGPRRMPIIGVVSSTCQPSGTRPGTLLQPSTAS